MIRTFKYIFALGLVSVFLINSSFAQNSLVFASPQSSFSEATELFEKEKYGAALPLFDDYRNQVQANDLNAISAEYYAAVCALNLLHKDAEGRLTGFAEKNSEHPLTMMAYNQLGNHYYNTKKYDKAIRYYEEVDATSLGREEQNQMRFRLAYSYFSKKSFTKAKPLFDRIKRKKHKYSAAASYYSGYIAFLKEDYDGALADFDQAEEDAAYKAVTPVLKIKTLYKKGDYDALISYAVPLTQNGKVRGRDEMNLYLGEAYYFKQNYDKAEQYYDDYLLKVKKPKADIQYRIGFAKLQNVKYKEAIDFFKNSALKDDEIAQNSAFNLGICYLKTGNKQYAASSFRHAYELDFDVKIKEEALINYAKLSYESKQLAACIGALKELLEDYPNSKYNTEAQSLISEAYLSSSNYKEAVAYLEKIPNKSERVKKAYQQAAFMLGVRQYNKNRTDEALTNLKKSLKHPITAELTAAANFWIGEIRSLQNDEGKAISAYAAVLKGDPSSEYYLKARYGLGFIYFNQKEWDKALPHYKYYFENAPLTDLYRIDAVTRLADCYYVKKDYANAQKSYGVAVKNDKVHADYSTFQQAVVSYILEDAEQAKILLSRLISGFSKSPYVDDALYQKALIDLETGIYPSAIQGFNKLINTKPNSVLVPYGIEKRAIAYSNLNQHDQALKDYLDVLDNHVTHPAANSAIKSLSNAITAANSNINFEGYLDKYKKANPNIGGLESVEFESAKSLYFNQRYKAAITALEKFIVNYPGIKLTHDARYYLAESYYRDEQADQAIRVFEQVVADNKTFYVNKATYHLSQLLYETAHYNKAVQYYSHLESIAKGSKDMTRAQMGLMLSYFELNKYEDSKTYAQRIIAAEVANYYSLNKAQLYVGKCLYAQNDKQNALPAFTKTLETATDENGAEAKYMISQIYYDEKDYDKSKAGLYELNKTFGSNEYWLGKSFLLIADNLIALDEDFQAKAALNSLIENSPIEEIVEEAKKKLLEIEEKNKEIISIDTTDVELEPDEEEQEEDE